MEASAALQIIIDLDAKIIVVKANVSDDDSTMRAYLPHIDTIKNARLPLYIHSPKFLYDLSHRI